MFFQSIAQFWKKGKQKMGARHESGLPHVCLSFALIRFLRSSGNGFAQARAVQIVRWGSSCAGMRSRDRRRQSWCILFPARHIPLHE